MFSHRSIEMPSPRVPLQPLATPAATGIENAASERLVIVAIVSQDAALADSLAWELQAIGYHARVRESVAALARPGADTPPCCLLLDVGEGGYWVEAQLAQLRQLDHRHAVIAIVEQEGRALLADFDGVEQVESPRGSAALHACIERACRMARRAANDAPLAAPQAQAGRRAG